MRIIQIFVLFLVCLVNMGWANQDNTEINEYLQKGYQAWQAGNFNEALNYYEDVLRIQPKQIDAINFIGVIYEEYGWKDKAEEKYQTAISLDRQYLPALSNLGYLYWNQGDLEKAAFYFQKRIQWGRPKDPWTIQTQKALKNILAQQGADQHEQINKEIGTK